MTIFSTKNESNLVMCAPPGVTSNLILNDLNNTEKVKEFIQCNPTVEIYKFDKVLHDTREKGVSHFFTLTIKQYLGKSDLTTIMFGPSNHSNKKREASFLSLDLDQNLVLRSC